MALHILTRSPSASDSLQTCLALARGGDALLLLDDGVYALLQPELRDGGKDVYFLLEDARLRGLESLLPAHAKAVDYAGMVGLTEQHSPIHTWG